MTILKYLLVILLITQTLTQQTQHNTNDTFQQWTKVRYNYMVNEPLPYVYGWQTMLVPTISQFLNPFDNLRLILVPEIIDEEVQQYTLFKQIDNKVIDITGLPKIQPDEKIIDCKIIDEDNTIYNLVTVSSDFMSIYICVDTSCKISKDLSHNFGQVNQVVFSQKTQTFFVSSKNQGIISVDITDPQKAVFKTIKSIENTITLSFNDNLQILAFATEQQLWFWQYNTDNFRFEYTKSFTNSLKCMAWRLTDSTLWVGGSSNQVSIFQFQVQTQKNTNNLPFYLMWNIGFLNGLPYADIQNISIQEKKVILSNNYAVVLFEDDLDTILSYKNNSNYHEYQGVGQIGSAQSPWRVFSNQIWMATGDINAIDIQGKTIFVSSQYGMTQIYTIDMTYQEKAEYYEEQIKDRMSELGYVLENHLNKPGDIYNNVKSQSDNEGMWNNMYMAAEAYRYKATQDPKAKQNAWSAFQAQQRLYNVIPPEFYGLMAKAVDYRAETLPDEKWFYCTQPGLEEFMYKGNASSDDVTSYFWALPTMIDYVCETQDEKDLVFSYIKRTMDYLIENDYQMINVTGQRTVWGFWDPENLNNDPDNYTERTINSMEILGYLAITYKYSGGDQKYLDAMNELSDKYQYLQNSLNWLNEDPEDYGFSDDELGFLALSAFFQAVEVVPQRYKDFFLQNLKRSWSIVQTYQPSLYTFQTALNLLLADQEDISSIVNDVQIERAYQELRDWQLEWIGWNQDNSQRLDVNKVRQDYDRYKNNMTYILRTCERAEDPKWNSNPYEQTIVRNGNDEEPGTPWLLPYWIGQVYELELKERKLQKQKFLEKKL